MVIIVARSTIAVGATLVYDVIKSCDQQNRVGSPRAIRKNPHAIDVGSGPNTLHNSWFYISTATSMTVN